MSDLLNAPVRQKVRPYVKLLASARKNRATSAAIVARGVQGKYQARRRSEVVQWEQAVRVLEALQDGGGGSGSSGGSGGTAGAAECKLSSGGGEGKRGDGAKAARINHKK